MHEAMQGGRSSRGRVRSGRTCFAGFALLVGAALALSACSRSQGSKASTAGGATGTSPSGQKAAGVIAEDKLPKPTPLATRRQIIYTADLHVRVARVSPASARAVTIVESTGGYLFSQDANLSDQADETLVFKVPPEPFARVLDRLSGLGTPLAKNIAANDVTDRVVDLEGRLKTATASATRLRSLLAGAQNVPDVVAIEHELATRESEVESLQGQLRLVQNQVQLATVTLVLTTKAAPHKADIPGFTKAFSSGWKAFADAAKVTVAVVGAVLPFAAFAGVAAVIVLVLRRRRRAARLVAP